MRRLSAAVLERLVDRTLDIEDQSDSSPALRDITHE